MRAEAGVFDIGPIDLTVSVRADDPDSAVASELTEVLHQTTQGSVIDKLHSTSQVYDERNVPCES
jgi:hypothetical protein